MGSGVPVNVDHADVISVVFIVNALLGNALAAAINAFSAVRTVVIALIALVSASVSIVFALLSAVAALVFS